MKSLPENVSAFIQQHRLISKGDKVLVAISGGADSVCLAWVLQKLGVEIGLAHVNYHLRAEDADGDEAFVRQLATNWQLPLHVHHADPSQKDETLSTQVWAREARYGFFERLMDAEGYACCALAHHADDHTETLLLSLMRGGLPVLLQGIPLKRDRYIRPLLAVSRAEIEAALEQVEMDFRTDASNHSLTYLRNRIRHQVIPAMRTIHPEISAHVRKRADWYTLQYALIEKVLAPYLKETHHLPFSRFSQQVGETYLPLLAVQWAHGLGIRGGLLEEVERLVQSETGKYVQAKGGKVVRTREGFEWVPGEANLLVSFFIAEADSGKIFQMLSQRAEWIATATEPYQFGRKSHLYVDREQLFFPLHVRTWREGDRMQPMGMKGFKKLSDIFIDEKYSPTQKASALVIEDQKGIIALSGFRIAERVKIQPTSGQVACLVIEDAD